MPFIPKQVPLCLRGTRTRSRSNCSKTNQTQCNVACSVQCLQPLSWLIRKRWLRRWPVLLVNWALLNRCRVEKHLVQDFAAELSRVLLWHFWVPQVKFISLLFFFFFDVASVFLKLHAKSLVGSLVTRAYEVLPLQWGVKVTGKRRAAGRAMLTCCSSNCDTLSFTERREKRRRSQTSWRKFVNDLCSQLEPTGPSQVSHSASWTTIL